MLELLRYDQGIYALDSGYIQPGLAAIHLIVEKGRVAIVDTASYVVLPRVLEALQMLDLTPASVDYVFLTHVHLDHAGGAGIMMQNLPEARLIVHPRGVRHMADPSKLFAAVQDVYGAEEAQQLYGTPLAIAAERIIAADNGYCFDLNGRTFTCLDTPGHARHHLCLLDSRSGCLFTGDIFGLSYRELDVEGRPSVIPTTTPTQFEPEVMHASINRILAYRPPALYLTHFSQITDVARLGADLHRLIDAHVAVAEEARSAGSGSDRVAQITAGLWDLMDAEALHQGWQLPADQWRALLKLDVELNAQGLDYWLEHA